MIATTAADPGRADGALRRDRDRRWAGRLGDRLWSRPRRAEGSVARRGRCRLPRVTRQFWARLGAEQGRRCAALPALDAALGGRMAGTRTGAADQDRDRGRARATGWRAPLPRRGRTGGAARDDGADADAIRQFRLRLPHAGPPRARRPAPRPRTGGNRRLVDAL